MRISRLPVYIILEKEDDFDPIFKSIEDISNSINFLGVEDKTIAFEPEISDLEFTKLFPLLGSSPQLRDRHSLANIWGPYRLMDQLDQVGFSHPETSLLERRISKDVYFRKLLLKVQRNRQFSPEVKNEVIEYFNTVKSRNLKVAIIDDDYQHGWDYAYAALFPNSRVTGYEYEGGEPFPVGSAHKFDLILLDLRLTEDPRHDESAIVGNEQMSGILKLQEIRKVAPLVPVIMCTASNKSWSYQAALDNGANGYWEKESPDFGIGSDYNLKNTLNLLLTIERVLSWSWRISPVFNKIEEILRLVKDPVCRGKIQKKRDVIVGQLQTPPSKFIREHYHLDSEKLAFLIVWSFVNELVEYFTHEEEDVFSTPYDDDFKEFCTYVPDKSGRDNKKYKLSNFAEDLINSFGHDKWFGYISFEFRFMKFLFYIREMNEEYKEYNRLREVRQALDYIHGIDPGDGGKPYMPSDLDTILDIWICLLKSDT